MAEKGKGFFSQSGPFMKYGTLVFDMAYISVLWLAFSGVGLLNIGMMVLPESLLIGPLGLLLILLTVLHVGPATSACFFVMNRRQRDMDTYVWREFWRSYTRNYKQGLFLSLALNIVLALLLFGIYQEIVNMVLFGRFVYILIGIQLIFVIQILFLNIYCFSMLARFDMSVKDFLRIGFFMANKHLPTTVLCAGLLLGFTAVTVLYVPILMFFLPGLYACLTSALLERVFRKYMPDEDEELEQEEVEGFNLDASRQEIIDRYTGHSRHFEDEEPSITIIKPEEEKADVTIVKHADEDEN